MEARAMCCKLVWRRTAVVLVVAGLQRGDTALQAHRSAVVTVAPAHMFACSWLEGCMVAQA